LLTPYLVLLLFSRAFYKEFIKTLIRIYYITIFSACKAFFHRNGAKVKQKERKKQPNPTAQPNAK
jgi:hypothetical protein